MNRQEIINGLRLHSQDAMTREQNDAPLVCAQCPYKNIDSCLDALVADAYFLLQQPAPAQINATGTEQLLHETQDLLTETLRDVTETINSLNIALATLRAEMRPQNDR